MKLNEFNSYDPDKQAEIVWENGVIEEYRTGPEYYYILYKVHGFFVEVAFHKETNEIMRIEGFE